MTYEGDIIRILTEAGQDGLAAHKIAMHVFNAHNNFFDKVSMDDVERIVYNYLRRNSQSPESPIERTARRGVYRLNLSSHDTSQLMLGFTDSTSEDKPQDENSDTSNADSSLPLFDF